MGVEDEFGLNHRRIAAIVHHFRAADDVIEKNIEAFHKPLEKYIATFGPINFAALEMIFREHKFNTHLIAFPSVVIESQDPDVIVVDPNDYHLHDIATPMPFVIGVTTSREKAEAAARSCGFVYDAEENLQNLRRTGVVVPRGDIGVIKPLSDLRTLGLHVPPLQGQPRTDRRQARWN